MSLGIKFIRHAQTLWNADEITKRDVELTELGRIQSRKLCGKIDLVICSTLKRSRETLDNSKISYKNVMFTDLCREILNGNIVNYYALEEVRKETHTEIKKRANDFINLLREVSKIHKNIIVITHYDFLKYLTGYHFENLYSIKYTSVDSIFRD